MNNFLDMIEKQNAQVDNIITRLERNDSKLKSLDLSQEELRGDYVQNRFVIALKHNTSLTALNISGVSWKINTMSFIPSFTSNITITSFVYDKNFNSDALKSVTHYVQLNTSIKKALIEDAGALIIRERKLASLPSLLFNSPKTPFITTMDLARNKLTELPKELVSLILGAILPEIGQLTTLIHLSFSQNRISSVPQSIGLLAELKILKLDHNQLHKLPLTIGNCNKLAELYISHNNLRTIPTEIMATLLNEPSQVDVLRSYFNNLLKGGKRSYNIKLMFVGNGNVGKTMLLRGLTDQTITRSQKLNNTSVTGSTISTDGIDICDWVVNPKFTQDQLPLPEDRLILSCWDFAGQEVYYTTHQFFLSQRSLYLVIFDLRHPEEELSRLEYWLQSIMSRTSNSPIVIVGTHNNDPMCSNQYVDKVLDDIDKRIIKVNCSHLVKTIAAVDSVAGAGMDLLRGRLISLALEQPFKLILELRTIDFLRHGRGSAAELCEFNRANKESGKSMMLWKDFKNHALEIGISDDKDILSASKFLHNLGVIVHFPDENLMNLVVINPQFLVDIMATIFSTKNAFVKGGMLEHQSLIHIWKEPKFPQSIHKFMLNLLQRFEICFSFDSPTGEDGSILFPSLLRKVKPAIEFVWPEDINWLADPRHSQYDRYFELDFFPSGLFSRLMVRLLQISEPQRYWRYGIILLNPVGISGKGMGKENAFLELFPFQNKLRISVRGGKQPAKFFRILVETFELLVSKWYNIKYIKRTIPCSLCVSKQGQSQDPHMFTLEECEREATSGAANIICPKDNAPIRLDQLVPDVVMSDLENRKIDFNTVKVERELARGGFGIVYKAEYNNQTVAMKKLIVDQDPEELNAAFSAFRREVWVMSGLRHPNIVQLMGFCLNPFVLVMEFIPLGTLHSFLSSNRDQPLDWPLRLKCASDIANGMLFLHTLNPPLMHRDFKSPNILMNGTIPTSNVVCKVADFGLSSQMWVDSLKENSAERDIANPTWLAPEVIKGTEYTVKSDVYSFGIILWELLTRKHPFQEYDCQFLPNFEKLVMEGKRPTMPSECSIPEYAKLITDCWNDDPNARPTFFEICDIIADLVAEHAPFIPTSSYGSNVNRAASIYAHSPPPEKGKATFVKSFDTATPVWCICVHNNQVWTAHGVDTNQSSKIMSNRNGPSNTSPEIYLSSSSSVTSPISISITPSPSPSPSPSKPGSRSPTPSPPVSPRNNLSNSPRNYSNSNSPRPSSPSFSSSPPPSAHRPSISNNSLPSPSTPLRTSSSFASPSMSRTYSNSASLSPPVARRGRSAPHELLPVVNNFSPSDICIWDPESGKLIGKASGGHQGKINVLFSVNDDIWSASEDGFLKSWNLNKNEQKTNEQEVKKEETADFTGFLMKKSMNRFSKHWQRRWFTLKGNVLTRFKSQMNLVPKEIIEIKEVNSKPHKRNFCISLTVKSTSKGKAEGTEMLITAQSQEQYDLWMEKLEAVTSNNKGDSEPLINPDLVGEMNCGFGAVKCLEIVDGRVWGGTRGGVCAWNIDEKRYTGTIRLAKQGNSLKEADVEQFFVNKIIVQDQFVWCAIGPYVVRIEAKTRNVLEWIEGHTAPIDDILIVIFVYKHMFDKIIHVALVGDFLCTCSSVDHSMRIWDTFFTNSPKDIKIRGRIGSVFEKYPTGTCLSLINSSLWIGGTNGLIQIWDPVTRQAVRELQQKHSCEITSIILVNNTVWVSSTDNVISIWLV